VREAQAVNTYALIMKDVGGGTKTQLIKTSDEGKFIAFKEEFSTLDEAVEKFKGEELKSKDTEGATFKLGEPADCGMG
jgi:hypothetical protein